MYVYIYLICMYIYIYINDPLSLLQRSATLFCMQALEENGFKVESVIQPKLHIR